MIKRHTSLYSLRVAYFVKLKGCSHQAIVWFNLISLRYSQPILAYLQRAKKELSLSALVKRLDEESTDTSERMNLLNKASSSKVDMVWKFFTFIILDNDQMFWFFPFMHYLDYCEHQGNLKKILLIFTYFKFLTHVDGLVNDMNGMETLLDEIKDWHWKIIVEPGDHPGKHHYSPDSLCYNECRPVYNG